MNLTGSVVSVSRSPTHGFSKSPQPSIALIAGEGVEGDAHRGATTQHLYLKRKDHALPNLAQVHLFAAEMLAELEAAGHAVAAGDLGENILTSGIDLLALPLHAHLHIGYEAVVKVTGLRTPCSQIDGFQHGLQAKLWGPRDAAGKKTRRAGIMSIVIAGGVIRSNDAIRVELPPAPHLPLPPV